MIGMHFHRSCSLQKKRNLVFLFKLSWHHLAARVFGYLMTSPIFTEGIPVIFAALKFPIWLTIGIAVSGL
jgi:hypothetical protein